MRAAFIAAQALLFAAAAEAAILRSGEHGDFTRLAITDESNLTWELRQEGRTATIDFGERLPDLDVTRAFERIDRNRIAAIEWKNGRLGLTLACSCAVRMRRVNRNQIAIDVLPAERPLPVQEPPASVSLSTGQPDSPQAVPDVSLPLVLPTVSVPIAARLDRAVREMKADPPSVFRTPVRDAPRLDPEEQLRLRDARTPPPPISPILRPTECGGVRRLASILRADPDAARASLPDALARYDPERPETVRALAFSYANSGFFAEALHISASNGRADRWLETLTAAVEGRNVGTPEGGPFRCGPAALLISLAAGQSIPALTPGDRTAVISFSSDLPDERKRDFLPSATDHLAKLGDDALAAELRALMPVEDLSPDPLSEVMETAKTILDAVDAGSADQTLIDNARLLLSELPSGEMRSGLEQGIAAALARQSEGLALAEHLKALPDDSVPDALSAAIKALSVVPEKKAAPVLAILLSWRERASTSDRTEAAEMLRRSNLSAIADQWSPHPRATAPTLVVPVIGARGPGQDWPGGDAGAGRASEDVRRLLAAHLTSEQETSPLDTINGARERLARARRSADLIERLLAAAPEQ